MGACGRKQAGSAAGARGGLEEGRARCNKWAGFEGEAGGLQEHAQKVLADLGEFEDTILRLDKADDFLSSRRSRQRCEELETTLLQRFSALLQHRPCAVEMLANDVSDMFDEKRCKEMSAARR